MNGCKIFVFLFHIIVSFLSFLRSGNREAPASENGHKIVSHREQKVVVYRKKRLWHLFISFYHVLFLSLVGESW